MSCLGILITPPSLSFRGQVAIVAGAGCAGDGIENGRAISIMLANEGYSVVCLDVDLSWASKTPEMVNSSTDPGTAIAFQGDVTSSNDCEEAHWEKSLEVNVSSMVLMVKFAILAIMRNEGEVKGPIVNMGSVAGLKGGTPHLLYPTSKGAVVNMTRPMVTHHAKDSIRVNCVCPGMLYTPMMYAGGMTEQAREARKARSLLGTGGTGWDCACAVTFLASNHARWITGAILPVDAGTTAAVGIGMPVSASENG
ncbi:hypothetical protein EDB81DRAFT_842789 [Dactylonectria macrodidyma]|uniref:Uncharacterized protein n=1 Tax=Dactylonectria macrodidyma TaxID=307937 RepID=A0A9P9ES20_9HYPO|nr:hypothetical protein EDB81DRAFT_842789 [Dactylonectria macrodidyma]